jgi:insertion element IS1 protein InsB
VAMCRADALPQRCGLRAELDAMGSDVRRKAHPQRQWHAIDPQTGQGLAYRCGRRQDEVLLKRQKRLEPCGMTRYDTAGWGPYARQVDAEKHTVGKAHRQQIASTHST